MRKIVALGPADSLPYALTHELANETLDVHYMHGTPNLWPLSEGARSGRIRLFCYFMAGEDRRLRQQGVPIQFVPCAFRDIGSAMLRAGVTDLYMAGRESPDGVSFGSCCGYSRQLLDAGVDLHLENNCNLPMTDWVWEGTPSEVFWCDTPIHLHKRSGTTEVDKKIASHILPLLPECPAIQVGVGGVPNSVLAMMVENKMPVKRIVSELFSPAMVPLMQAGLLHGDVTCTVAFGDTVEFYEFMHRNVRRIVVMGVEETNNSEKLAEIPNLVSINSCLEVDWTGQVNSEEINREPFSGSGGQLDFVLGATRSRGGMSFLCMPSRRVDKTTGEIRSRIVDRLHGAVTVPRNCVDWIVTERGAVNLRGLSIDARREALLSIG